MRPVYLRVMEGNRPQLVLGIALAILIAAGLFAYLYMPRLGKDMSLQEESAPATDIPSVNPVENTNPFENTYTNPFE